MYPLFRTSSGTEIANHRRVMNLGSGESFVPCISFRRSSYQRQDLLNPVSTMRGITPYPLLYRVSMVPELPVTLQPLCIQMCGIDAETTSSKIHLYDASDVRDTAYLKV